MECGLSQLRISLRISRRLFLFGFFLLFLSFLLFPKQLFDRLFESLQYAEVSSKSVVSASSRHHTVIPATTRVNFLYTPSAINLWIIIRPRLGLLHD